MLVYYFLSTVNGTGNDKKAAVKEGNEQMGDGGLNRAPNKRKKRKLELCK